MVIIMFLHEYFSMMKIVLHKIDKERIFLQCLCIEDDHRESQRKKNFHKNLHKKLLQ